MKALRSHLALPALLALASCGGGGGGTVVVPGYPPPPLYEIEPNDNALFADYIGEILPGDFIEIEGHITEYYPDPFDGFAFYALGPVRLVITLNEANPGADLDFSIYDPMVDRVIAAWETGSSPEVGVFDWVGPGEFHIVVASYYGDSDYLLQVDVQPLPFGLAATNEGPLEVNRTPSPSAIERFGAYHARESAKAPARKPSQVLLLSEQDGELLLLPAGALRSSGL